MDGGTWRWNQQRRRETEPKSGNLTNHQPTHKTYLARLLAELDKEPLKHLLILPAVRLRRLGRPLHHISPRSIQGAAAAFSGGGRQGGCGDRCLGQEAASYYCCCWSCLVPAPEKGVRDAGEDEEKEKRHLPSYAAGHGTLCVEWCGMWVWAEIDTREMMMRIRRCLN